MTSGEVEDNLVIVPEADVGGVSGCVAIGDKAFVPNLSGHKNISIERDRVD